MRVESRFLQTSFGFRLSFLFRFFFFRFLPDIVKDNAPSFGLRLSFAENKVVQIVGAKGYNIIIL